MRLATKHPTSPRPPKPRRTRKPRQHNVTPGHDKHSAEKQRLVHQTKPARQKRRWGGRSKHDASDVTDVPTVEEVDAERKRLKHRASYRKALTSTIAALIVVAAIAVLIATLFLPILQVSGTSMEPTLSDGEIIVLNKAASYDTGELVAFYYSGKVLIKRVIATPGDYVDIADDGTVSVNGIALDEPYVSEKSLGDTNIKYPYQVADNSVFVLGDHRSVSVDSRNSQVGCISYDDVIGRIVMRVWPLSKMSLIG